MLHIVNGDHVGDKLRGKIQGDVLVWREVYPVGPVYPKMDGRAERRRRAEYLERAMGIPSQEYIQMCELQEQAISDLNKYDEAVLWFEHDLFDQTIVCYLLHRFAKQPPVKTKLHLLCIGDYPGIEPFRGLGQLTAEQLASLWGTWKPIGEKELTAGSRIWEKYSSRNIEDHVSILIMDTSALPFAKEAFTLHLDRLPSPVNGLGIVEQTVLELIEGGIDAPKALFQEVSRRLHGLGMGDLEFWHRLRTMAAPPKALIDIKGPAEAFPAESVVSITMFGQEVLSGKKDFVQEKGCKAWYGGLRLSGDIGWRWDRREKRLVYL